MISNSRSRFIVCLCVGSAVIWPLLICPGCGGNSSQVNVRGTVTYDGEPLSNSAVSFFPPRGRPVTAAVNDQGQYDTELAPGEYVVTVNVGVEVPPGFKETDVLPPPKIVLPPKYTFRGQSTLKATVAADQSEPIDFVLD
jgi:hypothetical protein